MIDGRELTRDYSSRQTDTHTPEQLRSELWPPSLDRPSSELQAALRSSALVYEDDQRKWHWHPRFARALARVERNCRSFEICAHDADHLMHVLRNVGVLLPLLTEEQGGSLDHVELVRGALLHDLGYAMDTSEFELHHAPKHVSLQTSQTMGRVRAKRPRQTERQGLFPKDQHSALHLLWSEEPNGRTLNLADKDDVHDKPEEDSRLIWSLVLLADKLDYFRAGRVEELNYEQYLADYQDPETPTNWYYWLAYAIEDYSLEPDPLQQTLTIRYRFKSAEALPIQRLHVDGNVQQLTELQHWWNACTHEEGGYFAQRVFGIALAALESIGWSLNLSDQTSSCLIPITRDAL